MHIFLQPPKNLVTYVGMQNGVPIGSNVAKLQGLGFLIVMTNSHNHICMGHCAAK